MRNTDFIGSLSPCESASILGWDTTMQSVSFIFSYLFIHLPALHSLSILFYSISLWIKYTQRGTYIVSTSYSIPFFSNIYHRLVIYIEKNGFVTVLKTECLRSRFHCPVRSAPCLWDATWCHRLWRKESWVLRGHKTKQVNSLCQAL